MMKNYLKLIAATALLGVIGCSKADEYMTDLPVIPVLLSDIEAVNVNNEGQHPFVTSESVHKEAFMIGIKWVTDDANPGGGQTVGEGLPRDWKMNCYTLSSGFSKQIFSVGAFNAQNPAGSNISQYFERVKYLPTGVDEGFALLKAPDPGQHSFRVVYTGPSNQVFEFTTPLISLY